jgi:AcrR family transcriptional regulator
MTTRGTATQRRSDAIEAGMRVFADNGLTMSAVRQVAEEIGVSQPYVFRLFGTKQAFFLACLDALAERISTVFQKSAAAAAAEPLDAMGAGFRDLVADGVVSGLLLQACAAARGDEQIAARCRSLISRLLGEAGRLTGAAPCELTDFLASGALVLLLQAIGADLTGGSRAAVTALRNEETTP